MCHRCNHLTPLDRHLKRLFFELEKGRAETHDIAEELGIKDGEVLISWMPFSVKLGSEGFVFHSPLFPVYEQRDAAEYLEKILCQISSEASKVNPPSYSWKYYSLL